MDYSDRTYAFAKWADIGSVDFSQVMETSAGTVRKSLDSDLFILNGILPMNQHLSQTIVLHCLGQVLIRNVYNIY